MRFLSFSGARRPGRNSALPVSRDRAPAVGASIRTQYDAAAPLPRTCPTHVGVKLNDQAMTHQPTDRRTGQKFFRKKVGNFFLAHGDCECTRISSILTHFYSYLRVLYPRSLAMQKPAKFNGLAPSQCEFKCAFGVLDPVLATFGGHFHPRARFVKDRSGDRSCVTGGK